MFNILVVEDDINLNKLICSVLSQNGYKAFPAPNTDSGLEKLADNYIDLVI